MQVLSTKLDQKYKLPSFLMGRFHAALPVSDNRILVCGGCSAIGVLQDVHVFNIGTFLLICV